MEKRLEVLNDFVLIKKYCVVFFIGFVLIMSGFLVTGEDLESEPEPEPVEDLYVDLDEVVEVEVPEEEIVEGADSEVLEVELGDVSEDLYVDLDEVVEVEVPEEEIVEEADSEVVSDEVVEVQNEESLVEETLDDSVYLDIEDIEVKPLESDVFEESNEIYVDLEEISDSSSSDSGSSNKESKDKPLIQETDEVLEVQDNEPLVDESEKELTTYVFYKGSKKEIETETDLEEMPAIYKDEELIIDNEDSWGKEVVVYSEDHYNDELTVYSDIIEDESVVIEIFWKQEEIYLPFDSFDSDGNGLVDRISWVVPHLSEQTFEIIVSLDGINNSIGEINLTSTQSPPEIVNLEEDELNFAFSVDYHNLTAVECNFLLESATEIVLNETSANLEISVSTEDLEHGIYGWDMHCYDINNNSIDALSVGTFETLEEIAPPVITFQSNTQEIEDGDDVTFSVSMTAGEEVSIFYVLDFDDGSSSYQSGLLTTDSVSDTITHNYDNVGDFTASLSGLVDGEQIDYEISITVNSSVFVDTTPPTIELLDPEDDEVFNIDSINFTYNVTDNVGIENCTYNLYFYNNSPLGTLVYTDSETSVSNGEIVRVDLVDFDEGEYTWDVECVDTSDNDWSRSRDFEVSLSSTTNISVSNSEGVEYEGLTEEEKITTSEIQSLIDSINDFLELEEDLGQSELLVIDDLGIGSDLKFFKKKLLQAELDFQHNIDFIRDEERRENRREEVLQEIEDIRSQIPVNIEVLDSYEYQKNSIDPELEEVVNDYVEESGLVLDKSSLKALTRENEALQQNIGISSDVKTVRIEYLDNTKEITLVKRTIDVKDEGFDRVLEVIPKDIAASADELTFLNEHKVIKVDPIVEVMLDDLIDGQVIYYIDGHLDNVKSAEKIDTLAFTEEFVGGSNKITGFVSSVSVFGGGIWFYLSWVIFLVGGVLIAGFSYQKVQVNKLRKADDVVKHVYGLIEHTRNALDDSNVTYARELYNQINHTYPMLPAKAKKPVYNQMTKILVKIDKKDATNLIREFIDASKAGQKEYALSLYSDIQLIYERLPNNFKKKAYLKMRPHVRRLRRL